MTKHFKLDVLYITRPQVERWTEKELMRNINLKVAKEELEKRKVVSND